MKFFLDTADVKEIDFWLSRGVGEGVTTNPSILKKMGVKDPFTAWREIIRVLKGYKARDFFLPISVEVFKDNGPEMVEQARLFVRELSYEGTVVKIPILNTEGQDCLSVIRRLSSDDIAVNCTACVTWYQAVQAAQAGARYVSLLYRRMIDAGLDAKAMISTTRDMIERDSLGAEIIAGSIRELPDIMACFEAGAHIVTAPSKFLPELPQLLFHQKSVDTQKQFLADAGVVPS